MTPPASSDPSDPSDPVFRSSDPARPAHPSPDASDSSDSVPPLRSGGGGPRSGREGESGRRDSDSSDSSDSVFDDGSTLRAPHPDSPDLTDSFSVRSGLVERAADAALALAAERPWRLVSLRDIAGAAEVDFADLYTAARGGKAGLIAALSRRFDRAALQAVLEPAEDVHDRLFETTMARIEAMEPHRAALVSIARDEGPLGLAPRFPETARAILESAGVDTSGPRGRARVLAMAAVWARIAQVWRDDEGALNRTMAEIDKRLKEFRDRLNRVNAGF